MSTKMGTEEKQEFIRTSDPNLSERFFKYTSEHNGMEEAGVVIEGILKYAKEKGVVSRDDIKDEFALEDRKMEGVLKFLLLLGLVEIEDDQIRITESGLDFLKL